MNDPTIDLNERSRQVINTLLELKYSVPEATDAGSWYFNHLSEMFSKAQDQVVMEGLKADVVTIDEMSSGNLMSTVRIRGTEYGRIWYDGTDTPPTLVSASQTGRQKLSLKKSNT
jgi:hypothetical protein